MNSHPNKSSIRDRVLRLEYMTDILEYVFCDNYKLFRIEYTEIRKV